jgi:hypothetical protein
MLTGSVVNHVTMLATILLQSLTVLTILGNSCVQHVWAHKFICIMCYKLILIALVHSNKLKSQLAWK